MQADPTAHVSPWERKELRLKPGIQLVIDGLNTKVAAGAMTAVDAMTHVPWRWARKLIVGAPVPRIMR